MQSVLFKIMKVIRLIVIVIILSLVSAYIILIANGYKIIYQANKIQKTGMIYLRSNPKDVKVMLNGELQATKTPTRINNLDDGRYDIKLTKTGYHDWQKTLSIDPGYVSAENDIVLFLDVPVKLTITQDEKDAFNKLPNELFGSGLKVKEGSEIWTVDANNPEDNQLVTRISGQIKTVTYYSDKKHVLYQIDKEIHVIDINGSNNLKLLELPSENTAQFFVDDTGDILYYQIDNEINKVQIH